MNNKISYYIPKGKKSYAAFLDKEMATAANIKSREMRESILSGLSKIKQKITDGTACFWDGEQLSCIPYRGNISLYQCGRDFVYSPIQQPKSRYLLVAMDADECTIGYLNGKAIEVIWDKKSIVPRKHDAGGQSQRRFERGREEALKQWLNKCADKLEEVYRGELT